MTPAQRSRYFEGVVHAVVSLTGKMWAPDTSSPWHFRILTMDEETLEETVVAEIARILLGRNTDICTWVLGVLAAVDMDRDEVDEVDAELDRIEAGMAPA